MPRSNRRLAWGATVLTLALLAGGCAGGAVSPGTTPVASPSAAATEGSESPAGSVPAAWLPEWAGDDVPAAVADRRPLPFCGLEQAPAPVPGIFVDRAVRLCFWEAFQDGREAEFASVQSSVEGAPIATIYRLTADGAIEVLTDFTQDRFGPGGWQSMRCTSLVEAEGEELIGVDACDEARTVE